MDSKILETNRLVLRYFKEKDLDTFTEYRNNEEWMIYQTFKGKTKEEYRDILLTPFYIDHGSQLAFCLKETDELIGDLYVEKSELEMFIGYSIHPKYARKGFIYEIVSAFIKYIFEKYPDVKIVAETDVENIPSIRLLEKIGFIRVMNNVEGLVFELHNK
ncbi:GNAT family N-acetyltransferase [Candidatus Izimaplasma bacterium HR1]|uniref:GNAT family N-acetyltransferase n=1 Tax=Candidatus Izimoplasma sp. HR1 TaxID=1541959 RepID=UPI0006989541